jgi:hypothetical protein
MRSEELIRRDAEARVLRETFDGAYAVVGLPIHHGDPPLRPRRDLDPAIAPEKESPEEANRNTR